MTGLLPRRLQIALYRTSTYWRLAQVSLVLLYLTGLILLFGLWTPRPDTEPAHHAVRDLPDIPPRSIPTGSSSLAPIDRAVHAGTTLLADPERIDRAFEQIDRALANPARLDRALDRVLGTTGNTE